MAGNDVRVRLTPEGVKEVQDALRKVQRTANDTSRSASGGVQRITTALRGFRGVLAGLGLTASAAGLVALARSSLTTADAIGKAGEVAGVSTNTIQELRFAFSDLADVTDQQVDDSLRRFNRRLGLARSGAGPAVATFRTLGIELRNLDGSARSTDDILDETLAKIAGIEDPARRAAEASQVFGDDLGPKLGAALGAGIEKLDELRAILRDEGGLISEEQIAQATAFNDEMNKMSRLISAQFTQQVLDNSDAMQDFSRSVATLVGWMVQGVAKGTDFVTWLGESFAAAIGGVAADDIPRLLGSLANARAELDRLERLAADPLVMLGIGASLKNQLETQRALVATLEARLERGRRLVAQRRAEERAGAGGADAPESSGPSAEDLAADRLRSLQTTQSALTDERRIQQAHLAARTAADQRAFDQGVIDLEEFIRRRRAVLEEGLAAEIRILEGQLQVLSSTVGADPDQQARQEASLRAQIQARQIQHEQALDELAADRVDLERDGAAAQAQIEEQILAAEGRRTELAELRLQREKEAIRLALVGAQASGDQIAAALERFETATRARLNFEDIAADAQRDLESLAVARQRIEQDVSVGITTQLGGQARILELERARLPVLQQLVNATRLAAAATGDPAAIAQAEQLGLQVRQVALSVDQASNSMARFRDQAEQATVGTLTDWLANGITQASNLKDAFKSLALSIVDDLKRIAAQQLAMRIVGGASGDGGTSGFFAGLFSGGTKAASGGLIRGPGTETSDSIPARLSDGEYIVRARAVRQPGVLSLLQQINDIKALPKFATGGLVTTSARRYAGGGLVESGGASGTMTGRLEVGLADGLEARGAPVTDDMVIEVIKRNPRRIGDMIR